jgi:hypothetical protein
MGCISLPLSKFTVVAMSQITLELKNNEDEQLVLALLRRLGIHYSMQNAINVPNKETLAAIEEARNGNLERLRL